MKVGPAAGESGARYGGSSADQHKATGAGRLGSVRPEEECRVVGDTWDGHADSSMVRCFVINRRVRKSEAGTGSGDDPG